MQAKILTISDNQIAAGREVAAKLRAAGVRVEEDYRPEKIGYKVRESETQKVPYALVLGDKEVESGLVAVRARGRKDLGTMSLEAFLSLVQEQIESLK